MPDPPSHGSRDGEIRQQYENTYIGRPVGGEPTINDEADGVRFVQPTDLDQYNIHASMRQQIGDYPEERVADGSALLSWVSATCVAHSSMRPPMPGSLPRTCRRQLLRIPRLLPSRPVLCQMGRRRRPRRVEEAATSDQATR
ncbi:hypothetical protein GCM10023329_34690 [Streptomyces sanyensis]|uniref:Uncharacterized protein n=1 Tax=Streptomyces sanyensis TaxID=568869 RepID=A0ABP9ALK8_9ACTN